MSFTRYEPVAVVNASAGSTNVVPADTHLRVDPAIMGDFDYRVVRSPVRLFVRSVSKPLRFLLKFVIIVTAIVRFTSVTSESLQPKSKTAEAQKPVLLPRNPNLRKSVGEREILLRPHSQKS